METRDVISIIAIFFGPIFAVVITRILDARRERNARRMDVFRTLMKTRRVPITQEHVGALNLIEIEFRENQEVLSVWKELFQHFVQNHPRNETEQINNNLSPEQITDRIYRFNKRLEDERGRIRARLIHAMARALGHKAEQLDIFEGGYSPQGWEDEQYQNYMVRKFFVDLANKRAVFPIEVMNPPPTEQNDGAVNRSAESGPTGG